MKYVEIIFFTFLMFVCATVFADTAVVSSAVTNALAKASAAIPEDVPGWVVVLVGYLSSDLLVRAVPTAKPKSLFLVVSLSLTLLAGIFTKASLFLDKLVQNVKDPEAK